MSESSRNSIAGSIVGLVSLLAVAAFLLIGFTSDIWHPTWLVFLAIPVASTLTDALVKRKGCTAAAKGAVSLLATATFLVLGFEYGLWHPGWLVFFAIPIADILLKLFASISSDSSTGNTAGGSCSGTDQRE